LVVLLLGSYDPQTKELLYKLKEEVVKAYAGTKDRVYAFLLEELEMYSFEGGGTLILERTHEEKATAYIVNPLGTLEGVVEVRKERALEGG